MRMLILGLATMTGAAPAAAQSWVIAERDQQAQFRSIYGRCLYARQQREAERFLLASDAGGYDEAAIGGRKQLAARWKPQQCLDVALNAMSLRRLPDRLSADPEDLRPMLLEAAYVARFRGGPAWIGGASPRPRVYVSKDRDLARAQAADAFADCLVAAAPQASDALIRSTGGSAEERAAVRQLGPSLGPCVMQGQKLTLNPTDLRRLLVEGLWTASGAAGMTLARATIGRAE